ncbi:MAG: hypothetical protein JWN58_1, partial [Gammaproteobacteria bacterium]|nr:hypothetical protein [Gammaproteobacteria bacterium]
MPWRESCAMDERVGFIADHRPGLWTTTEDRFATSSCIAARCFSNTGMPT